MGTGATYALITNKRILGQTDLDAKFLQYLRDSHAEATKARWDQDGVFNTKLTLAGGALDKFQIVGSSLATDGAGHILNILQITGDSSNYFNFENSVGIDYEVGIGYAEAPEEVRINPRTGKPEYDHMREYIGESDAPTSVVDNGNGTMTVNVNSVTESGVDNAGRKVLIYKNAIDENALTAAEAIEELTVGYGGGNNTIVTSGSLGQTTISTTASDYTVVLLGPTVKRNSSVQSMTGVTYIGTITGNGGNPSTFDETDQRLLKTTQDATQITFTPYSYLTATDVQTAIQQMVDSLGAASGATRVGFDATALTKRIPTVPTDDIGIGNLADTFTASSKVQDAIAGIDSVMAKHRPWTMTVANGTSRTSADIVNANAINVLEDSHTKYAVGGCYFFQGGDNSGWYNAGSASNSGIDADNEPYMLGETCGDAFDDCSEVRLTGAGISAHYKLRGQWRRFYFNSANSTYSFCGMGGFVAEDCAFKAGTIRQDASLNTKGSPFEYRRCVIHGTGTPPSTYGIYIANHFGGSETQGLIDNCVIECPPSTGTVGLYLSFLGASFIDHDNKPLTIRNTVIRLLSTGPYAVSVNSSKEQIVFENCTFDSNGYTHTNPLVYVNGSQVTFRDCTFYATSGQCLGVNLGNVILENCTFVSGANTSVSDPQMIYIRPAGNGYARMKNCYVYVQAGSVRTGSVSNAMIELGGLGGTPVSTGLMEVDGLFIFHDVSIPGLHYNKTLELHGSEYGNKYRNITIDFNEEYAGTDNSEPLVSANAASGEHILVDGLNVTNLVSPTAALTNRPVIESQNANLRDILVQGPASANGGRYESFYKPVGPNNTVDGFVIDCEADFDESLISIPFDDTVVRGVKVVSCSTAPTASEYFYIFAGADKAVFDGVEWDESYPTGGKVGFQINAGGAVVQNARFDLATSISAPIFNSTAARVQVRDCYCRFGGTPQILTFTGADCLVMGNNFTGIGGTATITNSGTGSIGDGTLNVLS